MNTMKEIDKIQYIYEVDFLGRHIRSYAYLPFDVEKCRISEWKGAKNFLVARVKLSGLDTDNGKLVARDIVAEKLIGFTRLIKKNQTASLVVKVKVLATHHKNGIFIVSRLKLKQIKSSADDGRTKARIFRELKSKFPFLKRLTNNSFSRNFYSQKTN